MSRLTTLLAGLVLVAATGSTLLADEMKSDKAKEPAPVTVTGELVDLGCYLGHGAMGMKHQSCALKCIAGGMPMGVLTADKTLYLLTMSHEDADPYNAAKDMAALTVEITGEVMDRDGMKAIEVDSIKEVKAEESK